MKVLHSAHALCTVAAMLLWALAPINAQARLGETLEECIERYGEPTSKTLTRRAWFHKSVYFIDCFFHEGRCEIIVFRRVGETPVSWVTIARNEAQHMEPEEVSRIVNSMKGADSERWKLTKFEEHESGYGLRIAYASGLARASYTGGASPALVIFSHEHEKRRIEKAIAQREGELEFLTRP